MADPEQTIDVRDPAIDVEAIMARLRERIRERHAQAAAQGVAYDHLVDRVGRSIAPEYLDADLYYDLQRLRENADGILVSAAMRDRQFRIFNSILFRIENLLHRLVVKYINLMAGRQVVVNQTTAQIFAGVLRVLEDDERRLQKLEKQIAELQQKLESQDTRQDG